MITRKILFFVGVLALAVVGCEPQTREITVRRFRVLRVVDGDTFKVRYDGEVVSVRIWGIDAPEKNTAAGPTATEALRKLIDDREVRLVFCANRKRDNFGRLLARVFMVVDGTEIGPEMIRTGHAKKYIGRGEKSKKM